VVPHSHSGSVSAASGSRGNSRRGSTDKGGKSSGSAAVGKSGSGSSIVSATNRSRSKSPTRTVMNKDGTTMVATGSYAERAHHEKIFAVRFIHLQLPHAAMLIIS